MTGFPISTTHSLVGGLVGAGLWATGGAIDFSVLGGSFVLPLLASPLMALTLAALLYWIFHRARLALGVEEGDCVCVGEGAPDWTPSTAAAATTGCGCAPPEWMAASAEPGPGTGAATGAGTVLPTVATGTPAWCRNRYPGRFLDLDLRKILDAFHFLSAGSVGFARGLNDTPKIAALLVVLEAVDVRFGTAVLGIAIAAGGILSARKVAETVSWKITGMNPGQGFTANLSTAALVIGASRMGLPVSTTHVSVGSLFGIGVVSGEGDTEVIRNVILSWVITLPCAAVLAALVYATGAAFLL